MSKPVSPYELFGKQDHNRLETQVRVLNDILRREYQDKLVRNGEKFSVEVSKGDLTKEDHQLVCRRFEKEGWVTVTIDYVDESPNVVYKFSR